MLYGCTIASEVVVVVSLLQLLLSSDLAVKPELHFYDSFCVCDARLIVLQHIHNAFSEWSSSFKDMLITEPDLRVDCFCSYNCCHPRCKVYCHLLAHLQLVGNDV